MAVLACALATAGCPREEPVEAPLVVVPAVKVEADASAPLPVASGAKATPPRAASSPFVGRWKGIGKQDSSTTWPMVVDLSSTQPGVCAIVDYPSIPCHAEWICSGDVEEDGTLSAVEHVTDDPPQRCIDMGTMTMRVAADGTLAWHWSGSGQTASAKLRRETRPEPPARK